MLRTNSINSDDPIAPLTTSSSGYWADAAHQGVEMRRGEGNTGYRCNYIQQDKAPFHPGSSFEQNPCAWQSRMRVHMINHSETHSNCYRTSFLQDSLHQKVNRGYPLGSSGLSFLTFRWSVVKTHGGDAHPGFRLIGCRLSLASRCSYDAGSQQEMRHEIECFCATTYVSL